MKQLPAHVPEREAHRTQLGAAPREIVRPILFGASILVFLALLGLGLVTNYTLGGLLPIFVLLSALGLVVELIGALVRRLASDRTMPLKGRHVAPAVSDK